MYTISNRNNAPIFFNNISFDGKVNPVGAYGRSFFKILNSFQKRTEKQEFLHEIVFDNDLIDFGF